MASFGAYFSLLLDAMYQIDLQFATFETDTQGETFITYPSYLLQQFGQVTLDPIAIFLSTNRII